MFCVIQDHSVSPSSIENKAVDLMDFSEETWLSEMGIEDPAFFQQWPSNCLADAEPEMTYFSSETYSSSPSFYAGITQTQTSQIADKNPAKQVKTSHWNTTFRNENFDFPKPSSSSSSTLISFGNASTTALDCSDYQLYGNLSCIVEDQLKEVLSPRKINFSCDQKPRDALEFDGEMEKVSTMPRTSLQAAKDHVISERKRRASLNQRFISLSAMLPGLQKLDKASIIGGAIKYIKQLEGHANKLEEEVGEKPEEAILSVKRFWLSGEDDASTPSDDNFEYCSSNHLFPVMEVRVCDSNVLLRIHCDKHNGCIAKVYTEMQKLRLIILNSSVMPFGQSNLAITITAQREVQSMTAKDIARSLRSALSEITTSCAFEEYRLPSSFASVPCQRVLHLQKAKH